MAERGGVEGVDGVVTVRSPRGYRETLDRLADLLEARGLRVFATIDQAAAAAEAGLALRPTTLVVFGSPAAGTPVMVAEPLAALDLPLKLLVWEEGGVTSVAYLAPAALAARYRLAAELSGRLAGVVPLVEALVEP